MSRPIALLLVCVGFATAQPATIQIRSAASSTSTSDIAPGSIISVKMTAQIIRDPLPGGNSEPQPSTLTVRDSSGVDRPITIFRIDAPVLTALLPLETALGDAVVTLRHNGVEYTGATRVVPIQFNLFSRQNTVAIANAQNVTHAGVVEENGLAHPARPGNYLTLWGTGLGVETPRSLYVVVGGHEATVEWAGKAPGLPGLDQINIRLDPAIRWTEGCYVPIRVRAGGRDSNVLTISISGSEGACPHSLNLTFEELRTIDEGKSILFGSFDISQGYTTLGLVPSAVFFSEAATVGIRPVQALDLEVSAKTCPPVPAGTCESTFHIGFLGAWSNSGLTDAGETITLRGPSSTIDLKENIRRSGIYTYRRGDFSSPLDPASPPTPVFSAGSWIFSGLGGADILPFQVPLSIAPPLRLVNYDQVRSIDTTTALPIRWDPAGYSLEDRVEIQFTGGERSIICNASAQAGEFVVPQSFTAEFQGMVLSRLPISRLNMTLYRPVTLHSLPLTQGGRIRAIARQNSTVMLPVSVH